MKGHLGHGHAHINSGHAKSASPSPRSSIFSNFETVQLSTEERLYLHAARLGDHMLLKEVLAKEGTCQLNVNCVDYMGRNALHLAVDSEGVETLEILMEKIHVECMEEALLHAISNGALNIVRIIVDHPRFISEETQYRLKKPDPFFRTEEKYQYPPDITPLILAAHKNDHEMIQMFLARGNIIERPHAIHCQCQDCSVKQQSDSLKRSRSRMNAYKALSSPAYMALSNSDPITATFELRQEMMQVAEVEKEFQSEYVGLAEQCMDFACEMMDLCRGTQEVEAVLGEENTETHDPLARLRLAIHYNEKKFVAHPNCQQHLTSIWYGSGMGFLQSTNWLKKSGLVLLCMPFLPCICLAYIINPYTKVAAAMRCPVSKFIMHTISHFVFLILLAVATFDLDDLFYGAANKSGDNCKSEAILRSARSSTTNVQILIIFWIIGLIWIECKQVYFSGAREHFLQYYNYMDFSLLALYLASYSLRFVAKYRVTQADQFFNATQRIEAAGDNCGVKRGIMKLIFQHNNEYSYFMQPSRFSWSPEDPEIISDILFAVANILSFARTTYMMPSHELLGPLQISLGRMLSDIARFVVLFLLVLIAFMVGMTNLYRYYGSHIDNESKQPASETFKGLPETVHTLFFSIFGLIALKSLKIKNPDMDRILSTRYNDTLTRDDSSQMVDRVGMILFAIYQIAVTIVLVNMLIAMMSHSFEAIQGDGDVEWKFARTQLWMNYIDEGSTLPVPFNMIPTPKCFKYGFLFCKTLFEEELDEKHIQYDFKRRRGNVLPSELDPISTNLLLKKRTTYSDIIQRLVRRYLFKLDREKRDQEKVETVARAEDYEEEDDTQSDTRSDTRSDTGTVMRDASVASDLMAIDEDDEVNEPIIEPVQVKHVHYALSATPTTPLTRDRPFIRDTTGQDSSNEALRQLTRRATMKRSSAKRPSVGPKVHPNVQLDAIQRGQRMLDARLQDLQTIGRKDNINMMEDIDHVRHLLTESKKALDSLVSAVSAMQNDIHRVNDTLFKARITLPVDKPKLLQADRTKQVSTERVNLPREGHLQKTSTQDEPNPKARASHTRSDETSSYPMTSAGFGLLQGKDKKNKRWHSIKRPMIRRKKGGSTSDDVQQV